MVRSGTSEEWSVALTHQTGELFLPSGEHCTSARGRLLALWAYGRAKGAPGGFAGSHFRFLPGYVRPQSLRLTSPWAPARRGERVEPRARVLRPVAKRRGRRREEKERSNPVQ